MLAIRRAPLPTRARALAPLVLLVLAACGGGGGGGSGDVPSWGLVSGTQPTRGTLTFANPHAEPATVSVPVSGSPFRVDPASVPTSPVGPGEAIEVDVVFSPGVAGDVTASANLRFHAGTTAQTVSQPLHATVEAVTVQMFGSAPAFGTVPFGQEATRTRTLNNNGQVSDVTFTSASFPNADFELVSPSLPATIGANQQMAITIRYRPFAQLGPVAGDLVLGTAYPQGSVRIPLTATGAAGTRVIDLGSVPLTAGTTGELQVDVPAPVFSLTVEAVDPGVTYADAAYDEWFRGLLPPATARRIQIPDFRGPDGRQYAGQYMPDSPAVLAETVPYGNLPAHRLVAGGGVYRFELGLTSPPIGAALDVRAILRAAPGATPPTTATLDVNLWLGSQLGLSAATAANDAPLQATLGQLQQLLQLAGISLGTIQYFDWSEGGGTSFLARAEATVAAPPWLGQGAPQALNVLLDVGTAGLASAYGGPSGSQTRQSWAFAGIAHPDGADRVMAHEILHYLGLFHVFEDPISDTATGTPNLMGAGAIGGTLTGGQAFVVRHHPILRYP